MSNYAMTDISIYPAKGKTLEDVWNALVPYLDKDNKLDFRKIITPPVDFRYTVFNGEPVYEIKNEDGRFFKYVPVPKEWAQKWKKEYGFDNEADWIVENYGSSLPYKDNLDTWTDKDCIRISFATQYAFPENLILRLTESLGKEVISRLEAFCGFEGDGSAKYVFTPEKKTKTINDPKGE